MCRSAVRQSYEGKEEYRMKTSQLHKIVILVAISILLLCGCGRKIDSVELTNRLSEKEIEDLITEEIRKEILRFFADDSIRKGCEAAMARERERLSWSAFSAALTEFAKTL